MDKLEYGQKRFQQYKYGSQCCRKCQRTYALAGHFIRRWCFVLLRSSHGSGARARSHTAWVLEAALDLLDLELIPQSVAVLCLVVGLRLHCDLRYNSGSSEYAKR